jgi:hypothetical protein
MMTICEILTSPVPVKRGGQLLTTEGLHLNEHQIIFRRIADYATVVIFLLHIYPNSTKKSVKSQKQQFQE